MEGAVVLNSEQLEHTWDDWSATWEEKYEPLTLGITNTLLTFIQLNSATSILEVACGTGAGSRLCNFRKPKSAKLTSVDLSSQMVGRATKKIDDPTVTVQKENAEKLSFADASFDRYYAGYCLHLVENPDNMLKEAHRVLKEGGIAAFSVWGRKANSNSLTYMNDIAAAMNPPVTLQPPGPPRRSPFYLGQDPEILKKKAKDAGFKKVITFYQSHPTPLLDPETITDTMLAPPSTARAVAALPDAAKRELRAGMTKFVSDLLDAGTTLNMEALIVVVVK